MSNLYRTWVLALVLPLVQGCAAAAAQVLPALLGRIAIGDVDDRDPFRITRGDTAPGANLSLADLDVMIQQAECGDAQSQYWVASAIQNNFNTTPNNVEIYKWYKLSDMGHYAPASTKLAALNATISEAEISQASSLARQWRPKTEGCQLSGLSPDTESAK